MPFTTYFCDLNYIDYLGIGGGLHSLNAPLLEVGTARWPFHTGIELINHDSSLIG